MITVQQQPRVFTGKALSQIAFPLGGIGTGTISIGGRGELKDWEIFDHPDKGNVPPFAFFALWAQAKGQAPVAKLLERRLLPPYTRAHGLPQAQLSGVSRFDEVKFAGQYPIANLEFIDGKMPVEVALTAFNPLIPHNVDDSSLPVAIFMWKIKNPHTAPVDISLAVSLSNFIPAHQRDGGYDCRGSINEYRRTNCAQGLFFSNPQGAADDPRNGSLALATTWQDISATTRWYRGGWWDACHLFWDDFSTDGRINERLDAEKSPRHQGDISSMVLHASLEPKEEVTLPILLSWHFPNMRNPLHFAIPGDEKHSKLKKYVAKQFTDAWDAAIYTVKHFERLREATSAWNDAIWNSTLPNYILDAITSQISTLRTQTCFRLEDGSFYGWEGCSDREGCCHGNCTHVWNYEQALAFLFPELERDMRRTEFLYNTCSRGHMGFRTRIPRGAEIWEFKPCADGQMGAIIQAYRDWQLSGDDSFLKELWPKIKLALEYAWNITPDNARPFDSVWDPNKDGVMEGQQHNTYDIEFYGPNTMTTAMYLGALRACEEMARYLGEEDRAQEYRSIFEKGRKRVDEELWNGEYYRQKVEVLEGLTVPEHLQTPLVTCACKSAPDGVGASLNQDLMPKYQYGDGCLSDQLLGQLCAHVAGLGYLLDQDRVKEAVHSIYRHNFRSDLAEFDNVQRVYALNNEGGLLLCSWPKGGRPAIPFVYSDEVWTGIEYQVAAHLIYEGWIEEGLEVVKTVRDRYAGFNRNPWDELECGHHYVRAMASWSVLLALSGFTYSMPKGTMGFAPCYQGEEFQSFWSTGIAWGRFSQVITDTGRRFCLRVAHGSIELSSLTLDGLTEGPCNVSCDGKPMRSTLQGKSVQFDKPLMVNAGQYIEISQTV
ncbi:MAG: GH116 family glycosyl hydrolase [Limnochordia bacterium]|nr:GH116 family glycosyl hydrolase [Limnochordia bacterium]